MPFPPTITDQLTPGEWKQLWRTEASSWRNVVTRPMVARLLQEAHAPEPRYWSLLMEAIDHVGRYGVTARKPTADEAARSALSAKHRRAADTLRTATARYLSPQKKGRLDPPRKKVQEFRLLLDELFPAQDRSKDLKPGWYSMGGDRVIYYGRELWHQAAVHLFFAYRNAVDPDCGISRSGPAIKFVQSAMEACGLGKHSPAGIETMLIRAKGALERYQAELRTVRRTD